MSDLCYNCGDCHLPKPCRVALKLCDLCNNLGHTYNFCPIGVLNRDPSYKFWALCHNCDKWHLPQPCSLPLHYCTRCTHSGHLEPFCPVDAFDRKAAMAANDTKIGVKRQRTDSSDFKENVPQYVHPEVVRRIKLDATYEVLNIMTKGFSGDQVINYMSRPANQTNNSAANLAMIGNTHLKAVDVANTTNGHAVFSNSVPTQGAHSSQAATTHHAYPATMQPITPTPAPRGSFNEGVYTDMHERFIRGDLIQNQGQGVTNQDAANQHAANQHAAGQHAAGQHVSQQYAADQQAATARHILDNLAFPNAPSHALAQPQSIDGNNNGNNGFNHLPTTQGWGPQGAANGNAVTADTANATQGWIPQGAGGGNGPAVDIPASNQDSAVDNNGTQYNSAGAFGSGTFSGMLPNEAKDSMHELAQANLMSNTSFPSMMNDNKSLQANPLLQTPVSDPHVEPQSDNAAEADGHGMVQDSVEVPEPELKKNGQPKKRATRKRSEWN